MICEVMNDDGTMSRRAELEVFAAEHGIKIGTIADLIHYRMIHERTVQRIGSEQPVDSELGEFNLVTYRDRGGRRRAHGPDPGQDLRRRADPGAVHNMDPLRDLLLVKQPGRWSLRAAMAAVAEAGSGVVLLLGHPLDGDGCWRTSAKARAMHRQGTDHLQHRGCRFADPARPRCAQDAPDEFADEVQRDIRIRSGSCRIRALRVT